MKRLILYIAGLIFLAVAPPRSTAGGNTLYRQKPMIVLNRIETSVGEIAMEEVEAALARHRTIRCWKFYYPLSLLSDWWIYNGFQGNMRRDSRKVDIQ